MRSWLALVLAVTLLCGGCSSISVETDEPQGERRDYHVNRWLWGIVGGHIEVEGSRLARVLVDDTLLQKLVTFLSAGVYCPVTISVWRAADR